MAKLESVPQILTAIDVAETGASEAREKQAFVPWSDAPASAYARLEYEADRLQSEAMRLRELALSELNGAAATTGALAELRAAVSEAERRREVARRATGRVEDVARLSAQIAKVVTKALSLIA